MRLLVLCLVVGCGARPPATVSANGTKPPVETVAAPANAAGSGSGSATSAAAESDPNSGFDLYVNAKGRPVEAWLLDGERRTDRLPVRVRGLSPGTHTIEIEPPAGFKPASRQIIIVAGKSEKIEIELLPQ